MPECTPCSFRHQEVRGTPRTPLRNIQHLIPPQKERKLAFSQSRTISYQMRKTIDALLRNVYFPFHDSLSTVRDPDWMLWWNRHPIGRALSWWPPFFLKSRQECARFCRLYNIKSTFPQHTRVSYQIKSLENIVIALICPKWLRSRFL